MNDRFQAGVCLTFDDLFVENWVAAQPILKRFGAKCTFCVSHLFQATPAQLEGLLQLQDHGHEIALHTRTHPRLMPYLQTFGADKWVRDEVEAGIADHRAAGLRTHSFAFPHHVSTPETRDALKPLFTTMRVGRPLWRDKGQFPSRTYHGPTRDGGYDNIGSVDFRHRKHAGLRIMGRMLDTLADQDGVGVFTGHDIRPKASDPGFYSTQDDIALFLAQVRQRNLRFYRLSDLGKCLS